MVYVEDHLEALNIELTQSGMAVVAESGEKGTMMSSYKTHLHLQSMDKNDAMEEIMEPEGMADEVASNVHINCLNTVAEDARFYREWRPANRYSWPSLIAVIQIQ